MAKFKYIGEPCCVGRFGFLEKGSIIDLRQAEVDYIIRTKSTEYKRIGKEDDYGVGVILPVLDKDVYVHQMLQTQDLKQLAALCRVPFE